MLKKLFVEPYEPLYINGLGTVMSEEQRVNGTFIFGLVGSALFVTLSIIFSPWWMLGILGLVIFAGFLREPALERKRVYTDATPGESGSLWHQSDAWYSKETIKLNSTYKQQLLDYLDHLRTGGSTVPDIEKELRQWIKLEKEHKEKRKKALQQAAVEFLSRKEQLEEYKRLL